MIFEKLKKFEADSIARGIPIVGHDKGKWLYEKVIETQPEKILELGTANGYSGVILGHENAELITIEIDEKIAEEAKNNFKIFGINAKVIIGDAVEEAKKIANEKKNAGSFDLIFIDFAKKKYMEVLDDCIKLVRKNGL